MESPGGLDNHELSETDAAQILGTLMQRSEDPVSRNLCPGLDRTRAESALRADPEHLWCAHQAEKAGHNPTIFQADETGFWFGTMADETPESSGDCVYDETAANLLRDKYPDTQSAEKAAKAMGFELMTVDQGNHIAKNTPLYIEEQWSWYKTDQETRDAGHAIVGYRHGDHLVVAPYDAGDRYTDRGWRGARRVNYVVQAAIASA